MKALIEAMRAKVGLLEDYNTAGDIIFFASQLGSEFKNKLIGSKKGAVVKVVATYIGPSHLVNGPIQEGSIRIEIVGEGKLDAYILFERDKNNDKKIKMVFTNSKGKVVARQSAASKNSLYPHVKKLMTKGLAKL